MALVPRPVAVTGLDGQGHLVPQCTRYDKAPQIGGISRCLGVPGEAGLHNLLGMGRGWTRSVMPPATMVGVAVRT